MWSYDKRLQFPVKIKNPDPQLAKIVISQLGGPDGELGASMPILSIIQPVFILSLPPVSRGRPQPSSPRATPSPICSKIWPQKLHLYKNNPLGSSHHFSVYIATFLYIIIHGILIER